MRNKLVDIWTNRQKRQTSMRQAVVSLVGAFFAVLALSFGYKLTGFNILLAPFGATCVLLFALPDSPLAQPRNIFFGHLIAAFVGLSCMELFGFTPLSVAFAVGVAIAVMMLTSTTHPPAGANPIVIMAAKASWSFPFFLSTGTLMLIVCGVLFHKLANKSYPKYWI